MGSHLFTLAAIKGVELAVFVFLFGVVTTTLVYRMTKRGPRP